MTEEKVEYRSVVTELRVDMPKRKIFGLANVFGNEDSFGTVFDKGAFKRSIRQKFSGGKGKVKFLFNHDPFSILGVLTRLREGDDGLEFEGEVSETSLGNDVLTLVEDKALTDNSIGFRREKTEIDDSDERNPVLHFTQVELFDVSPVTFGANDLAVIGGVREQLGLAAVDKIVEEVGKRFQISIPDLGLVTRDGLEEVLEELLGGDDDGEQKGASKETQDEGRGKEKGTIDSRPKGADKSETSDNKDNDERDGTARLRLQKQKVAVAEAEGR